MCVPRGFAGCAYVCVGERIGGAMGLVVSGRRATISAILSRESLRFVGKLLEWIEN